MHRSIPGFARRDPSPQSDSDPPIRLAGPVGETPPDWLRRLVETELVPRLTDRAGVPAPSRVPTAAPVHADVRALVELLLDDDDDACVAWVDALRAGGADGEALRDTVIAPAARRLGELWDDDRCDFAQVSIGLGRLQALVHRLGDDALPAAAWPGGRLLLGKLPGADHLLGAVIVADAFRRAGWEVSFDPCASEAELIDAVRAGHFDVIALTVALDRDYPAVRALLHELRAASLNPSVTTMAGGPALSRWPALSADLGADLVPADAREAVAQATLALRTRGVDRAPADAPRTVARPDAGRPAGPPVTIGADGDRTDAGRRASFRRTAALRLAGTLASLTARAA